LAQGAGPSSSAPEAAFLWAGCPALPTMSDAYSEEAMLRATAGLRAQQKAEARKRDGPTNIAPRTSDMTVGDAIAEILDTFESDAFWADLGGNAMVARDAIAQGTADGRELAVQNLRKLSGQITELHHYFKAEQQVLDNIIGLLTDEGASSVTLDTVLTGVRTTSSEEDKTLRAKMDSEENKARLKNLAKPVVGKQVQGPTITEVDPWVFEEIMDRQEVTVTVPVPAATARSDVDVCIQATSLRIAVKGHSIQPAVLDGELTGAVDLEASSWSLEGSGDKRRVVLELEKKMGGFMWDRLLKA